MKKSIIEEIYLSSESLNERIPFSEENKKISAEAYKFYNQLTGILNDEQKKIFENFVDLEMGACAESELMHFKEGLKVGLRLAMECLI